MLILRIQICSGLTIYKMYALYYRHHKVFSLIKVYPVTHNSVKHEALIKQYLRSILEISMVIEQYCKLPAFFAVSFRYDFCYMISNLKRTSTLMTS